MGRLYLEARPVCQKTTGERFFSLMPGSAVFPAPSVVPVGQQPELSRAGQETPPGSFCCNLSRLLPDLTNRVREEWAAPTAVCVCPPAGLGGVQLIGRQ